MYNKILVTNDLLPSVCSTRVAREVSDGPEAKGNGGHGFAPYAVHVSTPVEVVVASDFGVNATLEDAQEVFEEMPVRYFFFFFSFKFAFSIPFSSMIIVPCISQFL